MAVCSIHSRCHVAGVGIPSFGSKFPSATVLKLASSSVLLIDKGGTHIASGVLIAPNVVLCAAHSIVSAAAKLGILLFFECDAKTAPGFTPAGRGSSPFAPPPPSPPPCKTLVAATAAQAKEIKSLETGSAHGLDYALLAIDWPQSPVNLPRAVHLPRPDYFYGGELLSIGHPVSNGQGEGTQATAGTHLATAAHGPHPNPKTSGETNAKEYTYTNCQTAPGMSGGGVFNEKGNLVGIITGKRPAPSGGYEFAFLNLGLVVGKTKTGPPAGPVSERLKRWMGGGLPLLPSDPQPSTSIVFNPPLQ